MIAIINVTGNNLTSLTNAIQRLGFDFLVTHCAKTIKQATHVILPGVGAAGPAMQALRDCNLVHVIKQLTQPVLGICLGMQLLYERSEESNGDCLGLIPGSIQRLPEIEGFSVPHMGWNTLQWGNCTSPLQQGINDNAYVYFVHSYAALSQKYALARCQHSGTFSAIVQKNNFFGMQFHPEKSAETGLQLLRNFLNLEAAC
jgi:glutamine amidotransferase